MSCPKPYICRIRPPFDPRVVAGADVLRQEADEAFVGRTALGFYSGTDLILFGAARQALEIYLKSLFATTASRGVVLADFNCSSVLGAVERAGGKPIYVDVDHEFQYHVDQLESAAAGDGIAAVIMTHFFGRSCWTPEIRCWASSLRARGVVVIEDCAHSFLDASQPDVGRVGDAAVFSFGNDKPLSVGKAGCLMLRSARSSELNGLVQLLGTRDAMSEYALVSWYWICAVLTHPDVCFPGFPMVPPGDWHPGRAEFDSVADVLIKSGDYKGLSRLPSVLTCLNLARRRGSSNLLQKVSRRLMPWIVRANGKGVDVQSPVLLGAISLGALTHALRVGLQPHVYPLRRVECYESAAHATVEIEKARRRGIEAGRYNWSPMLSELRGELRSRPSWAIHSSYMVNYPSWQS